MNLNQNLILLALFSILIIMVGCSHNNNNDKLGINSNELNQFNLIEQFTLDYSQNYVFEKNKEVLKIKKIENINFESAQKLIEGEIVGINAIFGNALSPYPGQLSNEIECDEKYKAIFKTKLENELNYSYFLLHASERYGLGACVKDLIKYKTLTGWIYCDSTKTIYRFDHFTTPKEPFENLEHFFLSFACN